jgi:hypothetical protein
MNQETIVDLKRELQEAVRSVLSKRDMELASDFRFGRTPDNNLHFAFETTSTQARMRRIDCWKMLLVEGHESLNIQQPFKVDSLGHQTFTLVDVDPRRNANPWVVENHEGKRFFFSTKVVREGLIEANDKRFNRRKRTVAATTPPTDYSKWG